MENKEVYLVTSGSYSDYSVDFVFENREDAEALVRDGEGATHGYDGFNDVEVYELQTSTLATRVRYSAWWDSHELDHDLIPNIAVGNVSGWPRKISEREPWESKQLIVGEDKIASFSDFEPSESVNARGEVSLRASGWDRERVIKSVADRRAHELAILLGMA